MRVGLIIAASFLYAVVLGMNSIIANKRIERLEDNAVRCSQGIAVLTPNGMATSVPICQ